MLEKLQRGLNDLYQVEPGHDVRDYLVTDRRVALAIGEGQLIEDTDESVLLAEEAGDLLLSVFLDDAMLTRLDSADPLQSLAVEQLDDLWKVLEGISHFNYLVLRAASNRRVTLLELELQAEIDKFVGTYLLLLEQGDNAMTNSLHDWLFDSCRLVDGLDRSQRARYEAASSYASRFCHRIAARLAESDRQVLPELRHFYRLDQAQKISHIHSCAFA